MKILEFRKITIDDQYNEKYNDGYAWSRVYEYQLVIDMINKYRGYNKEDLVHNTSWGFQGVHVVFKKTLDELGFGIPFLWMTVEGKDNIGEGMAEAWEDPAHCQSTLLNENPLRPSILQQ